MAASIGLPDQPFISVVMPVYNAERYVAEAIESILAQSYPHFEFIVVDDGSADRSPQTVRDYAARDARVRPLFLEHGGRSRAINAGIAQARGQLIARMDADDVALPQRFEVQVDHMRRTGVAVCGSWVRRFYKRTGHLWFPESHEAIRHELLFRCALLPPAVMLLATVATAHPYDELAQFEDYEMWTRLAPHYRMGNVPQVLLKYRAHERQSHVVEAAAFRNDRLRYGTRYFCELFPHAPAIDFGLLFLAAGEEPLRSLSQLRHVGKWLSRLAQLPDEVFRQRMALRWLAACQKSAGLGPGCYHVYRQMAPQFGVPSIEHSHKLWLACTLRIGPGSRLYAWLRRLRAGHTRWATGA